MRSRKASCGARGAARAARERRYCRSCRFACHARDPGAMAAPRRASREAGAQLLDQLELRSERDDPTRVQLRMAGIIVALDVREVDRAGDAREGIELAQIARQVLVIGDAADVALEMADIDRI